VTAVPSRWPVSPAARQFSLTSGTVPDLNTLVPAGGQISDATAINDNGQIVANGFELAEVGI
jgi:uncharacterized membrane protein